jgi:hypothetical protein
VADSNSVARSMHDLGLAAWFGGSLMGAVGLNGAAAGVPDAAQRTQVASRGWKRWSPVNAAAIGAHLLGGALIVKANKGRIGGQRGVAGATGLKTGLTVAALAATAVSGVLGAKVGKEAAAPTSGATEPSTATPQDLAAAQRPLKIVQWLLPVLTGAILVVNARMGEQQRPSEVVSGLAGRILPG